MDWIKVLMNLRLHLICKDLASVEKVPMVFLKVNTDMTETNATEN